SSIKRIIECPAYDKDNYSAAGVSAPSVSFVFQDARLLPYMNVLENVTLPILDLFDNPVGYLTVLQFFRLRACEPKVRQNCIF
ncbi:MAG: hypothetical protein LBB22_03640, partial [Treponema sp.]|nr:hypothetical protein [Treponema sp.]